MSERASVSVNFSLAKKQKPNPIAQAFQTEEEDTVLTDSRTHEQTTEAAVKLQV